MKKIKESAILLELIKSIDEEQICIYTLTREYINRLSSCSESADTTG